MRTINLIVENGLCGIHVVHLFLSLFVSFEESILLCSQTILRQLGQLGHGGIMINEADLQLHQRLQDLYRSTRAAKVRPRRHVLLSVTLFSGF